MNHWNYQDGVPYPMGATWHEANAGYNFCLYSKMATQLSLYFFNKANPQQAVLSYQLDPIGNKTGALWHCFILETALNNGDSYAYRANGDNTIAGNRFDPSKLLQDPWAKAVFFPPAFSSNAAIQSGDNIGMAALSLLVKQDTALLVLIRRQGRCIFMILLFTKCMLKGLLEKPRISDPLRHFLLTPFMGW